MKIINFEAENVKRLKAVRISPTGAIVEISGRNGQGKSSVLDAIWWAAGGTKPIQSKPVRIGADRARICLDLGEIKITRTFIQREGKDFTTDLTVESAEGLQYKSPQQVLNRLLGDLTFDPLAFTRMPAREQLDALKRFVPDFDWHKAEQEEARRFEARTDVNREARLLRAQAAGITVPDGTPAERVDTAALVADLEEAGRLNAEIDRAEAQSDSQRREVRTLRDSATARLAEVKRLRDEAQTLLDRAQRSEVVAAKEEAQADEIEERLAARPGAQAKVDTAALRERFAAAERTNAMVARLEERARTEAAAAAEEAKAAELTAQIEALRAEKRAAIAGAKMPLPGIDFGDGEILLNGVPFDQASSSEQLRTSVAIAMALNPRLRVLRVKDGSLLDEAAMAILSEMAEAADYQIWVEVVQSGRQAAIVIEDGEIAPA